MANLLDELNATTLKVFRPKKIQDLAFKKKSPFLAYLREDALPHDGGAFIQNTFLYGKTIGGAYAKGQTFDLTRTQIIDATKFDMRYYVQNDTQFLEDIRVENRGAAAVFKIIDVHQDAMFLTMNEILAIDLYRHGQASGSNISDNRSISVNGMAEAYNDGVTNSWDGNIFSTYGLQTRNSTIGSALNSIPYWFGDSSGNAGAITYAGMVTMFLNAKAGDWQPNLITGNKAVYGYVMERLQPQQQFGQEDDYVWGGKTFTFMGAKFMLDEYAPSSVYGVNDPRTGSFLTSAFTSGSAPASASNLPASTSCTPGETIFMHTTKTFQMQISSDPLYQFGWTGYKEAQNSTIVAGQLLVALNVLCQAPSYNIQGYGINS